MTNTKDLITFGKYKGKSFDEISNIDPSYILWLAKNVDSVKLPKKWLEAVEWDVREEEGIYWNAFESWNA